ncbi:MAG: hypothetical protein JW822_13970 [Spirochaetales bacterium]|nr:hypothetical protein [Spirochaetales bacterium]
MIHNKQKYSLIISAAAMCLLFVILIPVLSDELKSEDWYYRQTQDALSAENYTQALSLLEQAKALYPDTTLFNIMLADLYYRKELYSNALTEYQEAETKIPADTYILNQIAFCYGLLNQEEEALTYYEKVLALDPADVETIDWMGWVYQKIYQLKNAEELLLKAIERFGLQGRLAGTLASVYADLYEYEKAKYYYQEAIKLSLADNAPGSAAIYYYNLSIIEKIFYNYAAAFTAAQNAIDLQERASGRRMKGSLLHMQMDFQGAKREYENAAFYDDAPYSKINLAELDKDFGNLLTARERITAILDQRDLSWMLYYSTNTNEYYERLYKLAAEIYTGLAQLEWHTPRAGLIEEVGGIIQSIIYRIQAWYYKEKYKLAAINTGRAYLEADNHLNGYLELMEANTDYKDVALKYCLRAKNIETLLIPKAIPSYTLLQGLILSSPDLLEQALTLLDSYWQKDKICHGLQNLIPFLEQQGKIKKRRLALNRLYGINPGGLIQYGLGLPVELFLEIDDSSIEKQARAHFINMLKKAGSELAKDDENTGFQYQLYIKWDINRQFSFQLIDKATNKLVRSGILTSKQDSLQAQCADLSRRMLFEYIYREK